MRTQNAFNASKYGAYDTSRFTDADFALARESWRLDLCGDARTNSATTKGMTELLRMRDEDSIALRAEMNRNMPVIALFGEVAPTTSGELKLYYDRVLRMALPYGTVGCKGYGSSDLLADVVFALTWLHDNMYGINVLTDSSYRSWKLYDWWDWYVGAACPLMDALMIIEKGVDDDFIQKMVAPVKFFRHQMRTNPTPAEAMSRIVTLTPLALITRDRDLLATLYDECDMLLASHDDGNNMRRDFCCMSHGMPYNSSYGVINLSRIGKVVQILERTPLAYPLANKNNLKGMVRYCFAPVMYNGRTLAPMNGRAMQYDYSAVSVLRDIHYLYGVFDEEFDLEISQLIHAHGTPEVRAELISSYDTGISLEEYRNINSLKGTRFEEAPKTHVYSYARYYDALTNPAYHTEPREYAYMWYSGDVCVQHRHASMIGLRMSSERAYAYECINGANGDGWYTGDGALYLYTPTDDAKFMPKWWAHVDKHLIPGTTVDDRLRESMFFDEGWLSSRDFVGGVLLANNYLTATMDYESFHNEVDEGRPDEGYGRSLPVHHCSLTARKSWFFMSRAIVCIGVDITANDGYGVHTVVENILCDEDYILADGRKIPNKSGEVVLDNVGWIHLPKSGGYHFPLGGKVTIKFYENNGQRLVAVYVAHGINPKNQSYAYVILPNATSDETANYDVNDVQILRNDSAVQAVREASSGLTGYAFRSCTEFDGITPRQPMVAMTSLVDGEITSIAVCEPTQKRDEFGFSVVSRLPLTSSDGCVAITHAGTCSNVNITCDSAKGRTYSLQSIQHYTP